MRAEMGMGTGSQELDRFQHLVSDLFARVMLTPSEEIDAEVALALPRILENLAVDDVRLLRFDGEGRTLTGIERSAHGAVPPAGTQPAAESRDWYVSRLATGQPLAIVGRTAPTDRNASCSARSASAPTWRCPCWLVRGWSAR